MPCPFGYTAEDTDDDAQAETGAEGDGQLKAGVTASVATEPSKGKGKVKGIGNGKPDPADDPVGWFYANQIKSEAEFQAKKGILRAEAKKRLTEIMDKKSQRLMWPSDSEFDDLSFSSGELSELDSDVHSLASLRSCAESWVENARYTKPAEATLKWLLLLSIVPVGTILVAGYQAWDFVQTAAPLVQNGQSSTYVFLAGVFLAASTGVSMLAAHWQSKRMLLLHQLLMLVCYSVSAFLVMLVNFHPLQVDDKMHSVVCAKWGVDQRKSPYCARIPATRAKMEGHTWWMFWSMVVQCGVALLLMGVGFWYTFELCFIEKKAAKHVRRHKRHKHTIPWDKIKVVGPPVCGSGAWAPPGAKGRPGAKAAGGGCPVMHAGAGKDKNS